MLKCNELKNKWFPELIAFILWDTKWPLELSGSKNLERERLEQIQPLNYLLFIHYFRIDHNAPCLPPPPPPEFCIPIVSNFSWVLQSSLEKSKTMVRQSFGGGKHGALWSMTCENGELTNIQTRSVSSLQDVIDKSKQKLKPQKHQRWNIFKNCLVKQGLKLFSL